MELNRIEFLKLFHAYFDGNCAEAARQLGLSKSHIAKVLSNNAKTGEKFIDCVIAWCDRNNMDWEPYITLTRR